MTTAPEAAAPDTEAAEPQAIDPAPATAAEELDSTLLGAIDAWLSALRTALARAVDITVLEARLAALNLAFILAIAVACGLLLATAWIALFAAIVAWLHEQGLSWSAALSLIGFINLALAGAGGYAIYRMSNNLLFRATRKFIMHGHDNDNGERDAASGPTAGDTPPAP